MFDKHYHYSVDGRKTFEKLQAIMWSTEKNLPIKYHTPAWMDNVPTHIEPQESLDTLCKRSAEKLRAEYNYIRLWFSGGIDSTYMLDTFVDNQIHIDEIVTVGSGIPRSDWEIDTVATPYLNKIRKKIPNTKITIKKPGVNDYKNWYKNDYFFENHSKIGKIEGFYSLRLGRMLQSIQLYGHHRKTVNLVAFDKPCIIHRKGEWYTFFLDTFLDIQIGDSDNVYHLFYNDDPLIFTKQCHILKRTIMKHIMDPKEYNQVCFNQDEKYQTLRNGCVRSRQGKPQQFILKSDIGVGEPGFEADSFKESQSLKFLHDYYPELYKKWLQGIDYLNMIGGGKWFNKNNARLGDVGVFADFKSIDTNSTKTVDELYPNGFTL